MRPLREAPAPAGSRWWAWTADWTGTWSGPCGTCSPGGRPCPRCRRSETCRRSRRTSPWGRAHTREPHTPQNTHHTRTAKNLTCERTLWPLTFQRSPSSSWFLMQGVESASPWPELPRPDWMLLMRERERHVTSKHHERQLKVKVKSCAVHLTLIHLTLG